MRRKVGYLTQGRGPISARQVGLARRRQWFAQRCRKAEIPQRRRMERLQVTTYHVSSTSPATPPQYVHTRTYVNTRKCINPLAGPRTLPEPTHTHTRTHARTHAHSRTCTQRNATRTIYLHQYHSHSDAGTATVPTDDDTPTHTQHTHTHIHTPLRREEGHGALRSRCARAVLALRSCCTRAALHTRRPPGSRSRGLHDDGGSPPPNRSPLVVTVPSSFMLTLARGSRSYARALARA